MASLRLPRFKRVPTVAPIRVTERDRAIILLVHRHRFLRSWQIISLIGAGQQPVLRRLQPLYHHGYLDRPRAQIDYYHRAGSRHIVYGLGIKGVALFKQELGPGASAFRSLEKNASVRRPFLEHALLVSDIMVAIELACRKTDDVRFIGEDEILLPLGPRRKFKWRVKANNRVSLGIIPDRVFALDFPNGAGGRKRAFFFLEADRGTMPVVRRNLSQSSFHRKLLAYEATWVQGLHRSLFGFHRFRVLTVTPSAARLESMMQACAQLERGLGLFLFADASSLLAGDDVLATPWRTLNGRSETLC